MYIRTLIQAIKEIQLIVQQSSVLHSVCELAVNPVFAQASKQFDANRPSAVISTTHIIPLKCNSFVTFAFGRVLDLVPLAESVVKLNAVCMHCFKDAAFTKRLGEEKKVEVIGGADKYMAVCRDCYNFSSVHSILAGAPIKNGFH